MDRRSDTRAIDEGAHSAMKEPPSGARAHSGDAIEVPLVLAERPKDWGDRGVHAVRATILAVNFAEVVQI